MKKLIIAALICSTFSMPVFANSAIDALRQAENEIKQEQLVKQQKAEIEYRQAVAAAERSQRLEASKAQAEASKHAAIQKAKQAEAAKSIAQAEVLRAKENERHIAYEEELRKIQLESLKLDLKAKSTRVDREDDIIDSEIKRADAQTDVIQSEADAKRNISKKVEPVKEKNFLGF